MAEKPLPWLTMGEGTEEILRRGRLAAAAQPNSSNVGRYASIPVPPPGDLAELRRQQAQFARTTQDLDRQNSWMAVPALAPAVTVAALESAIALAARLATPLAFSGPLLLTKRMPYRQVGDNWSTRMGRRADKYYKDLARAKDGYEPGPRIADGNGKTLIPDIRTPPRGDPEAVHYIEVKPNSLSGRAAAARQVQKYRQATGRKVRPLFYDPERFK